MKRLMIFASMILLTVQLTDALDYRQTIKGRVIDKESHAPIGFATIALTNTTFSSGTISDEDGYYKIENVPVGRVAMTFRFIGYETITIQNLEVIIGKELVVDVEMTESSVELDEVVVKAHKNKEKPLNALASVSARTFSVEESQRYAGSNNDVSRMAMNFAGVKASNDAVNEIVIRGNSPVGVLFRLEGVDIPNPNHFGDGGTSGGPVSMLNNNVLSNSDFLTGAFPAEYGNTVSGVFDLRMRKGNQEKHEFIGQVGLNGYEFGAEGPLSKKSRASYIIHYRYSSLKLLSDIGLDLGLGSAIPDYQDLTFKLNFPSNRFGHLSVFGLAGKSAIKIYDSERDTTQEKKEMFFGVDYETDAYNSSYSGVFGVTHSYIFGNSAYSKLILSASTIRNIFIQDSLSTFDRTPTLQYESDFTRTKLSAKFFVNKKFNSKNTFRIGISATEQDFTLVDSIYDGSALVYRTLRNYDGGEYLLQLYAQYQLKLKSNLQFTLGFNSMLQTSTNNFVFEPRAGMEWNILDNSILSLGYGKHSVTIPIEISHQKVKNNDGTISTPNKNIDFMESHHFVLGYDQVLNNDKRLKAEIYYQYISQTVVEKEASSYSLLNRGSYTFVDVNELQNGGKGYNYGVEFTFEKFMDHGMYFLTTLSLYESKYRGSDGVLRNTAFNGNYVYNLLGGKEFTLGQHRENPKYIKKLTIDSKFNISGGQRYSPINLEASRTWNKTIYDETRVYTEQVAPYARLDVRIGFKLNGKRSTQEFAIDFQNMTNRKNPFYVKYDPQTGNLKTINQLGFMPNVLYRISF